MAITRKAYDRSLNCFRQSAAAELFLKDRNLSTAPEQLTAEERWSAKLFVVATPYTKISRIIKLIYSAWVPNCFPPQNNICRAGTQLLNEMKQPSFYWQRYYRNVSREIPNCRFKARSPFTCDFSQKSWGAYWQNLLGQVFSMGLICLAVGSYSGVFYLWVTLKAHFLVNADLIYHSMGSKTWQSHCRIDI